MAPVRQEEASTKELEAIVFGHGLFGGEEPEDAQGAEGKEEDAAEEAAEEGKKKRSKKAKRKLEEEAEEALAPTIAWHDPDDASLQVNLVNSVNRVKHRRSTAETKIAGDEYERRLREQFVKNHGSVQWAQEKRPRGVAEESEDEEEGVAATSARPVTSFKGGRLPPTRIDIIRQRDLPLLSPGEKLGTSVIEALQFHPSSSLVLTGGRDHTLRMFQVNGEDNPKIASYFFKNFNILNAAFTPTGDQVLMTSSDFQMFGLDVKSGEGFPIRLQTMKFQKLFKHLAMGPNPDLAPGRISSGMYSVCGEEGAVFVCDLKSKQPIRTLRMGANAAAAVFSPLDDTLWTADWESNIYQWDLGTGRCRQKVKENWAVTITQMAVQRPTQFTPRPILAVGTKSGNIDLLDLSGPKLSSTPERSIDNLTTRVDGVRFHTDGEVLAAFSRMQHREGTLKLIHIPTGTVFQNWPTATSPVTRVSAFDFSRTGGYVAIGSETGKVLIYKMRHYEESS